MTGLLNNVLNFGNSALTVVLKQTKVGVFPAVIYA